MADTSGDLYGLIVCTIRAILCPAERLENGTKIKTNQTARVLKIKKNGKLTELKEKNVVLSKNTVFDHCEELVKKKRHFGKK